MFHPELSTCVYADMYEECNPTEAPPVCLCDCFYPSEVCSSYYSCKTPFLPCTSTRPHGLFCLLSSRDIYVLHRVVDVSEDVFCLLSVFPHHYQSKISNVTTVTWILHLDCALPGWVSKKDTDRFIITVSVLDVLLYKKQISQNLPFPTMFNPSFL